MAQTKRKRRTKHRGTAAGTVEARGKTSKATRAQTSSKPSTRQELRVARMNRKPTWGGAATRAAMAAALLFAFTQIGLGPEMGVVQGLALSAFALAIYVPLGYWTDVWIYNRRQRRKQQRK